MKKLIAFLLLIGTVLTMAGCPNSNTPGGGGGDDGDDTDAFLDTLGERNYNAEDFIVSVLDTYDYEVYAEEDAKEILDEAVYKRNRRIENRFNVKIKVDVTRADGTHTVHINHIRNCFNDGNYVFDFAMLYVYKAGILVTGACLYDLREDIPYVRDSLKNGSDWWSNDINTAFTVSGKQYVGVSDYSMTALFMTYAMIFNKNIETDNHIAEGQGYTSMYDMVNKGGWTLDRMRNIVKEMYSNAEGSPAGADVQDSFGFICDRATALDQFAPACNIQYIANDGVSTPELFSVGDRVSNAFGAVYDLFYNSSDGAIALNVPQQDLVDVFAEGRSFLIALPLYRLSEDTMHNMEDDFGILPYPKADANQTKYYSGTVDNYSVICILSSLGSEYLDRIGTMIEALSAETHRSVISTYYDLIISHHNTRDQQSVPMLEIIMEGRLYDFATLHYADLYYPKQGSNDVGLGLLMRNSINENIPEISVFWTSVRSAVQDHLDELTTKYETMYG